jgi:hypothetical protein
MIIPIEAEVGLKALEIDSQVAAKEYRDRIVASISSSLLKKLALNEFTQIDAVATRYANRLAIIPQQVEEPIGIERLLHLAGETLKFI